MPTQRRNNWNVRLPMIRFFGDTVLGGNRKVSTWSRTRDILFHVRLIDGKELDIVLVDEYILGLASMHKVLAEFPTISCVVTGGSWNRCSEEAVVYGLLNSIGVFNVSEFASALTRDEVAKFAKKHTSFDTDDSASSA